MPRTLPTVFKDVVAAARSLFRPAARPDWNRDPAAIVIQATSAWPQSPPALALNVLPDALVWGDGRIVWAEAGPNDSRRVSVGRLQERELAQLLERVTRAGFFHMKSWYPSDAQRIPYDRSLCVHLLDRSHEVCACDGAGPRAFADLYRHVSSGAGAAGGGPAGRSLAESAAFSAPSYHSRSSVPMM